MAYRMALQEYIAQGSNPSASEAAKTENKISDHSSCRVILQQILTQRQHRNARYSLRAFARDLHVSPSFLSEVLNGKYGLSKHLANQIADRLGFDEKARTHFCSLADLDVTDSRTRRARGSRNPQTRIETIEIDSDNDFLDTRINEFRTAIQKVMHRTQSRTLVVKFRS